VANLHGEIAFRVLRDGRALASRTDYAWAGGGLVLTITTVLPAPGLALELVSTYAGAPSSDTTAIHVLSCHGEEPTATTEQHDHVELLHPVHAPRGCAYDHAQHLIDALAGRGVTVEASEISFQALEQVE
jgi:hypothetical protein